MDTSTKEEDDTWTQVKRRPGRRLKNSSATDVRAQPSLVNPQPRPASELEAEYRKIRQQWQQSSCFSALQKSTRHRFNPKTALKRAICLGIGTFDPVDGGWEARRRTYTQFIAFVTMVETLGRSLSRGPLDQGAPLAQGRDWGLTDITSLPQNLQLAARFYATSKIQFSTRQTRSSSRISVTVSSKPRGLSK